MVEVEKEEALTFQEIDKILNGSLSAVISEAWHIACAQGYSQGYTLGKRFISALVGWESRVKALKNSWAYEIAIKSLADACDDAVACAKRVQKRWGHLSGEEQHDTWIASQIAEYEVDARMRYEREKGFFRERFQN